LAVSIAALISVVLGIALLMLVNGPPLHIGGERLWIRGSAGDLVFEVPDGSGFRSIVEFGFPPWLLLFPMPVYWLKLHRDEYRRSKTRQGQIPISIVAVVAITWLFVVIALGGDYSVGLQLELAAISFVALLILALPAMALLRAVRFLTTYQDRQVQMRMARNECVHCGYSMQGNISGICPECGRAAADGRSTQNEAQV